MTQTINLTFTPSQAADKAYILGVLQKKREFKHLNIKSFKIVRKSIDARGGKVRVNLGLLVSDNSKEPEIEIKPFDFKDTSGSKQEIIIVGAGPAGLFAALKALELGIKPIILERGVDVNTRRKDIAKISRENIIDENSNYCFGEGGAGTFSDGKLYTRSKKRGNIREVLELLYYFGADEDILINAHPHIGSDRLPDIIKNIRNKIIEKGGEVRFSSRMTDILLKDNRAVGVKLENGESLYGPVFLATGHSARDTYLLLKEKGIKIEPKGLAIGVRVEHPQSLIDRIQYHSPEGRGKWLPPAEYSFVTQADGRGVYTFCMCPGGVIVPAVSSKDQIVVNGMSASFRSGRWANSGLVVELHPGDVEEFKECGELEMMRLQENLEKKFAEESGNKLNAPAQKIADFLEGKESEDLPSTSYAPGIHPADFNLLFPKEISKRLKGGLTQIGKKCPHFIKGDGVMIGLESRTSSPIRIPRQPDKFCHVSIQDLYPIGEGSGYAGGIVSSALDGMNAVQAYYNTKIENGFNT